MATPVAAEALALELSQHQPHRLRPHPVDSLPQLPEDNLHRPPAASLRLEAIPARF